MEFKYQVTATNTKGDFVNEVFRTGKEADIRQKQLYNEVDDSGLWKWGTIRTINLQYSGEDTIPGKLPNCIAA